MSLFGKAGRDVDPYVMSFTAESPGPGTYNVRRAPGDDMPLISMKMDRKNVLFDEFSPNPGPSYDPPRAGIISSEPTSSSVKFPKELRFNEKKLPIDDEAEGGPTICYGNVDKCLPLGRSFTMGAKLHEKKRHFSKYINWTDDSDKPGPGHYDSHVFQSLAGELEKKPSASFGTGKKSTIINIAGLSTPGPGTYAPQVKSDHESFSIGSEKRSNIRGMTFNKLMKEALFCYDSPGPIYKPNHRQIEPETRGVKMKRKKNMKLARKRAPGPGAYSPKYLDNIGVVPKGANLVGKEREVVDIFTNSKRKARFMNEKQFGVWSPGPKYYLQGTVGDGKSYSIPKSGMNNVYGQIKKTALGPGYNVKYHQVEKKHSAVSFAKSKRRNGARTIGPGPASSYNPGLAAMSNRRRAGTIRWVRSKSYGGKKGRYNNVSNKDNPGVGKYSLSKTRRDRRGFSFGGLRSTKKRKF